MKESNIEAIASLQLCQDTDNPGINLLLYGTLEKIQQPQLPVTCHPKFLNFTSLTYYFIGENKKMASCPWSILSSV